VTYIWGGVEQRFPRGPEERLRHPAAYFLQRSQKKIKIATDGRGRKKKKTTVHKERMKRLEKGVKTPTNPVKKKRPNPYQQKRIKPNVGDLKRVCYVAPTVGDKVGVGLSTFGEEGNLPRHLAQ